MKDSNVYKSKTRLKEMIGSLISEDPEMLEHYIHVKSAVNVSLDDSYETVKSLLNSHIFSQWLNGHEKYNGIHTEVANRELLDLYIRKAEELPSREPLYYGDYAKGWLSSMALDLALLNRINTANLTPEFKNKMQVLSAKTFRKISSKYSDRIAYICHFPATHEEYGRKIIKTGIYNTTWSIPLPRLWYSKVYLKGLAINDIAGKKVVVTNADELPEKEQIVWEDEKIRIFKAEVAYAKTIRKGKVTADFVTAYSFGDPGASQEVQSISYEDFLHINPTFLEDNSYIEVTSNTVPNKGLVPVFRAKPECRNMYNSSSTRISFNNYTPEIKGFLEKRYIAVYQNSTMKEPKVASGTTPLRSVSVLRGRIIQDVLGEMGVVSK